MPRPRLNPDRVLTPAEKQAAYRKRQKEALVAKFSEEKLLPSPPIPTMPGTARWNALIKQARISLETCREEMEGYFEERSEEWQESEKGEQMQEHIDQIGELMEGIENLP